MNKKSIDNYAATLAIAVGQQEAALHRPQRPQRPLGIENCATGNCQNQSMGAVPDNGRPWWFWLAVGAGVGGLVYMASKSGLHRNPDDEGAFEIAQRAAAISVQAGIPTILWGSPGIGKTSWLESLGQAMDAMVFTVIGSTKDPADIGGMMKLDGSLMAPKWAREIEQRSLKGLRSVLFLDEFSSMTPLVHAALLRVVRDKIAGECDLDPKNGPLGGTAVHVVCAANPRSEGAAAIDLPPPAANRMLHLEWPKPSGLAYGLGLVLGWPIPRIQALPHDWRFSEAAKSARKHIAYFVQRREGLLLDFPKSSHQSDRGRAWPSPRSWEMAADVLGAARAAGASEDVQNILVKACVGQGAGGEFNNWLRDLDLPNPEDILKDPTSWDPPKDRSDKLWAVANSVVLAVATKPTKERWLNAWHFMAHVIEKTDFADAVKIPVDDLHAIRKETPELKEVLPPREHVKLFYPLFRISKIFPELAP